MTNKKTTTNPLIYILIGTLVLLAIAGLIIYSTGYRYISAENVKFTGWVYEGQPFAGKVSYADGTKGDFSKEKTSSIGKIIYSTGDIYEGEIKGIMRHGNGKITYKATGNVYEGQFENDLRTGTALITYSNGDKYEGQVFNGKFNGLGKYTFADGSWYYGEFYENMKDGVGEFHWADGSYYYGSYANDKRNGKENVTITLFDGSIYSGKPKMVFSNGDTYTGDFQDDERTGNGIYTWSNNEKYEGQFVNGVLHGQGTYYYSESSSYTGQFSNGIAVE